MTKGRVQEILKVRLVLEGMAVEEAAARVEDVHIEELESLNALFAEEIEAAQ